MPCPVCSKTFILHNLREHIRKHEGVNAEELLTTMNLPTVSRKRNAEIASEGPVDKRIKTINDLIAGMY